MDEQIMSWATSRPEVSESDDGGRRVRFGGLFLNVFSRSPQDWHLGGKCDVYLWGAGRHGQLAEAGRNVLVPVSAPSFSQAQQVTRANVFLRVLFPVCKQEAPAVVGGDSLSSFAIAPLRGSPYYSLGCPLTHNGTIPGGGTSGALLSFLVEGATCEPHETL